jgi:hypothetical protein
MRVDHRAHRLRLGLEAAQLVALVATGTGLVKSGITATTLTLLAMTVLLSVWLIRTPRPPLPGDHEP